jgi:glycosyltransferase involved in cell wall biosynthesis
MKKLISIITVVYNDHKNIEKTIQSVLEQDNTLFEYIIIDGKSSDGTINIINKYHKSIDIIVSEKDTGIYDAMNKGSKLANGKYIYFLNSGDYFVDKNTLKNISDYLKNSYDVVCGNILRVHQGLVYPMKPNINKVKYGNMLPHQGMFMKKLILEELGYFDTSYRVAADFDLACKLVCKLFIKSESSYRIIDNNIAYMPSGGASSSRKNTYLETYKIIKNYFGYFYALLYNIAELKYTLESILKSILIYCNLKTIYLAMLKLKVAKK